MTSKEKAKVLLLNGIVVKKEDIVAKGYIKSVRSNYNPPLHGFSTLNTSASMAFEIDFQCLVMYNPTILQNSPMDSEYYIIRKKKEE